jgi:hypothetical protein
VIPLDEIRKIDPEVANHTNEELEEIRQSFYEFGQLMFDDWLENRNKK